MLDAIDLNKTQVVAVRDALEVDRKWVADAAEKYPVEYVFGGMRFVFESRQEIEEAIKLLNEELKKIGK